MKWPINSPLIIGRKEGGKAAGGWGGGCLLVVTDCYSMFLALAIPPCPHSPKRELQRDSGYVKHDAGLRHHFTPEHNQLHLTEHSEIKALAPSPIY